MSSFYPSPLYRSDFEHDACGVGFIARINGERSYDILDRAVTALKALAHRGAIDADAITGDGAGILTQIPVELLRAYLEGIRKPLYNDNDLGVGMIFLPREDDYAQAHGKRIVERTVKEEGLAFLAWREVPVDPGCLGQKAQTTRPFIVQALVARVGDMSDDDFERKLFLVQKISERRAEEARITGFYICSFSCRTVVYKGLLNAPQIRKFFVDFKSKNYLTSFAIFHQRYSTNTFPTWHLAQPFRFMAHNGEINTVRGNRNLMRARESSDSHGHWGDRFNDLRPLIQPEMSDSASFDNCLQTVILSGRSALHATAMMMPSAWENDPLLPQNVREFYHYHSCIMEPWDGPAAIVFTDGRYVAASLDRNGLRPARYKVYDDGIIVLASETGLIPDGKAKVVSSGRLGPGRMIAIDLLEKRMLEEPEIKQSLANQADFGAWCREHLADLHDVAKKLDGEHQPTVKAEDKLPLELAFGYDLDELEMIVAPMAETGTEPTGSMGDDTPLAVLSHRPRLLYTYFKQLFAQVTNPAIDSIRERSVMSLNMQLGGKIELLEEGLGEKFLVELKSPVLLNHELAALEEVPAVKGKVAVLKALFARADGPQGLEAALSQLARQAVETVEKGVARVLVLSDRGVSAENVAIPMLLAAGAVHQALVKAGVRLKTSLVCETGEAREVHQIATLLGFGANAVNPYLALEIARDLLEEGKLGGVSDLHQVNENYRKAINSGLLKIMAKMGISTLYSYQGAQIFEALGIGQKVVDECFFGTPAPIGGIGYEHIAEESLRRHARAYPSEGGESALENEGYYRVNRKGGEFHGWNPKVVAGMHKFLRSESKEDFRNFIAASDEHPPVALKDLLKFRFVNEEVPLDEVEPIEDIRRRFTTAGMSLGALSPETHECLAIAMNKIGGKSNSGEGGEDPRRFSTFPSGENANSAIKQVASGRFGVTAEYLASAKEIEIKIAQGAKPGEGGQLPGHKVSPLIARLRFSVPGVTLISPPPHHDIYSIEDLAQLIFDLKEVNPRAKVCVKLVSCSGVGTVAAGVAKAYADVVLVSGHEGGTGASPISSIKNAGSAWEIGLAEAHQVLMMNNLRGRVVLRTDGGMKTGRDIVIAAILGAEEFNFGTAALIAAGCAMFRVCHLNSCPVGVATQRDDLRAKFKGKPENIINYFNGVAEDVRGYLARLGFRTLEEIVGRTELLEQIEDPLNPKTKTISLAGLLHNPDPTGEMDRIHTRERNDRFGNEGSLDDTILQDAKDVISHRSARFVGSYKVKNVNRCVGTHLSGEVAYSRGNNGLIPGAIDLTLTGSAGQSLGTFLVQGVRIRLIGEANDYVGKGMNGGEIILRPRPTETFAWHQNIIAGNTCLYGATGGYLFAAGRVGERFGVRNSGATAVIEGAGDHCCEYMTKGTVVVLGRVGTNFGAGMSGGLAFVFDAEERFDQTYNKAMVEIERLQDESETESLRKLVELHQQLTSSPHAARLLDNWEESVKKFWKVIPHAPTSDWPKQVFDFQADQSLVGV
jgi:glutamate synthase (ferredoxin)